MKYILAIYENNDKSIIIFHCDLRSNDVLEEGLKKRLVSTEGFPFTELLSEFKNKLPQPLKRVKWSQPDFEGLVVSRLFIETHR